MELSDQDFQRLREFIYQEYGIQILPAKRILVQSRLQKRIKALNHSSFREYCDYLLSSNGRNHEMPYFANSITTNKTDFFREPDHFEFLTESAIPDLIQANKLHKSGHLNVWSAGCSSGEEPYTLAIVLSDFFEKNPSLRMPFSILASDVSSKVLDIAKKAVYPMDRVQMISMDQKRKYLLKSKNSQQGLIKIAPDLRKLIQFKSLNFMNENFGIQGLKDVIFCRNVIIYFDKIVQQKILGKLCNHLVPGGYLFLGHSETIQGLTLPLTQVKPTVYMKH